MQRHKQVDSGRRQRRPWRNNVHSAGAESLPVPLIVAVTLSLLALLLIRHRAAAERAGTIVAILRPNR